MDDYLGAAELDFLAGADGIALIELAQLPHRYIEALGDGLQGVAFFHGVRSRNGAVFFTALGSGNLAKSQLYP